MFSLISQKDEVQHAPESCNLDSVETELTNISVNVICTISCTSKHLQMPHIYIKLGNADILCHR